MLGDINYSLPDLFAQLGLPHDSDAIDTFIANNQLPEGKHLLEAAIWNASQRQFLQEAQDEDSDWADVVDELNVCLSR